MSEDNKCPGCGAKMEQENYQCPVCGFRVRPTGDSRPAEATIAPEGSGATEKTQDGTAEKTQATTDGTDQTEKTQATTDGTDQTKRTQATTDGAGHTPDRAGQSAIDPYLQHLLYQGKRAEQYNRVHNELWQKGNKLYGKYGSYEVVGKIGEGGMGKVYEALHREWKVPFIVKVPKDFGDETTFLSEVRTWLGIHPHPRIVSPYIIEHFEEVPHLFIEKASQGSLSGYWKKQDGGKLAIEEVLVLGIQTCECLEILHKESIIHRDIKPANLLLGDIVFSDPKEWVEMEKLHPGVSDGIDFRKYQVKLTDLGLAMAISATPLPIAKMQETKTPPTSVIKEEDSVVAYDTSLASVNLDCSLIREWRKELGAGKIVGTPEYMSSEQLFDSDKVDERSDLYSLGVMLYLLVAGALPYSASERTMKAYLRLQTLERHLAGPDARKKRNDCPIHLAGIIQKLLAKKREDRFNTAQEVREELVKVYEKQYKRQYPYPKFEQVEKWEPKEQNNRAVAYLEMGDEDKAMQIWDSLLNTDLPPVKFNYVLSRLHKGKMDMAEFLKIVQTEDTEYLVDTVIKNARVSLQIGHFIMEAKKQVQGLLDRYSGNLSLMTCAALLHYRCRQWQECVDLLEKIPIEERSPEHWAYLGGACWEQGKHDIALDFWEEGNKRWEKHSLPSSQRYSCDSVWSEVAVWVRNPEESKDISYNLIGMTIGVHEDTIPVALSGDGKLAMSVSRRKVGSKRDGRDRCDIYHGIVKIWDMETGQCLHTLEGHLSPVNSVAFSRDGKFAISGSGQDIIEDRPDIYIRDGTVKIWDATTGRCLHTIDGHTERIEHVAMDPDGKFAISGSKDKTARIWDMATGQCLHTLAGHTDAVTSVAIGPDGKFAISGSKDKTVKIWDMATGQCLHTLTHHIGSVAISPDGTLGILGTYGENVKIYSLATGQCLRGCLEQSERETSDTYRVSPDGKFAMSSGKTVKIWDIATGQCLHTLTAPMFITMAISFDGKFLLASYGDELSMWECLTMRHYPGLVQTNPWVLQPRQSSQILQEYNRWQKVRQQIFQAFSQGKFADAASLYVEMLQTDWHQQGNDQEHIFASLPLLVRPFDTIKRVYKRKALATNSSEVTCVAISPNGKFALSGSADQTIAVWNLTTNQCLHTFTGHRSRIASIAVSFDGKFAISSSQEDSPDAAIHVWDMATGQCLYKLMGHTREIRSVAISANGRLAISGSADRTVKIWDMETRRCLQTLEGHGRSINSVAISHDGQFGVSSSNDKTVMIWNLTTGCCLDTFQIHTGDVTSVAISPDARFVISGSYDQTVKILNPVTGQCLHTLAGHTDTITSVAISPDARFAISGSYDQTIKIWDIATGQCLYTITGDTERIASVAVSPDAKFVLSGSKGKSIHLWNIEGTWNGKDDLQTQPISPEKQKASHALGAILQEYEEEDNLPGMHTITRQILWLDTSSAIAQYDYAVSLYETSKNSEDSEIMLCQSRAHLQRSLQLKPDFVEADWMLKMVDSCLKGQNAFKPVPTLIQGLKDSSEAVRKYCAWVLGKTDEKTSEAVLALAQGLQDQSADVRKYCAWALSKAGEKTSEVVLALAQGLQDQSADVRKYCARALGKAGKKAVMAISALAQGLQDPNADVRKCCAWTLGKTDGKEAIPVLIQALKDKNECVRRYSTVALNEIGEKAVPDIVLALQDKDGRVRRYSAEILGKIGEKAVSAVPALIQTLQDKDNAVRRNSAWALSKTGEKTPVAILALILQALTDKDNGVRHCCKDILSKIREEAASVPAFAQGLRNQSPNVREYCAEALSTMGEKAVEAVPALIQTLQDQDDCIRKYCTKALEKIYVDIHWQSLTCEGKEEWTDIAEKISRVLAEFRATEEAKRLQKVEELRRLRETEDRRLREAEEAERLRKAEIQRVREKISLADLAEKLSTNPLDYDLVNEYVNLALERKDVKSAVQQLVLFASNLEQAGKSEEACNCYEYILEIEPNNEEARKRLNR